MKSMEAWSETNLENWKIWQADWRTVMQTILCQGNYKSPPASQ